MRRFNFINNKDVEYVRNYLYGNGYHPKWDIDCLITTENEDAEIRLFLDKEDITYDESNPHLDEVLSEISAQLDVENRRGKEEPCAYITLISGRTIDVTYRKSGCFLIRLLASTDEVFNRPDINVLRSTFSPSCGFDELRLVTHYIGELLDIENYKE